MYAEFTFRGNNITLPKEEQAELISAFYATLGEVGKQLHAHSRYKDFTFSRLMSDHHKVTQTSVTFTGEVTWRFSSATEETVEAVAKAIKFRRGLVFGDTIMPLEMIELREPKVASEISTYTMTPVVVSVTQENGFRRYFKPYESEFATRLAQNVKRRYEFLTGRVAGELSAIAYGDEAEKVPVGIKERIVEGWKTIIDWSGDAGMVKYAVDAGVGEKNALGFGMLERVG